MLLVNEGVGMSIITVATSKGGAGKTTIAQVLLGAPEMLEAC